MADIPRYVEVTIHLSSFDMGREFARMRSDEQAQFFNGVAAESDTFLAPACIQWKTMRDEMDGLPHALRCFKDMAQYGRDFEEMEP